MTFSSPIDIALFVIEIIGCVSFATSGAFKAIRKKADILGIIILTLIEVFGGGLLRDLIINQGAPHIFWDPEYLILAAVCIAIAVFWFFIGYFKKTAGFIERHRHDMWIYILDAVGIAVFCVGGVRVANASLDNWAYSVQPGVVGQYVYVISLGVITGVGGGMFRDIFVNELPMVFKKHFYMTPCILGTMIFTIMYRLLDSKFYILSLIVGLAVIIGLRTLAIVLRWNLPSARGYNELVDGSEIPPRN